MTANVYNVEGHSPVLLLCEHASNHIPRSFNNLGLTPEVLQSHIAWDPGAFEVACIVSDRINAKLVYSTASRLLYDCNRPPGAIDAVPERSEIYDIPGNKNLSPDSKAERLKEFYIPFSNLTSQAITSSQISAIVTIHSFSPVYHGQHRSVELGVLHDTDSRLADLVLNYAADLSDFIIQRNEPYGPEDGVMHTLREHGVGNGIHNVMLEIRNDLISTENQRIPVAEVIADIILRSLDDLGQPLVKES